MNEQKIVNKLKTNEHRPLWDMSRDEIKVLKRYRRYVEMRSAIAPYEFKKGGWITVNDPEGVYRLFSDFEISTTEKVWREFDIVPIGNRYLIEGIDLYGNLAENFVISIDQLCEMVNFGGVKFKGQKDDHWRLEVRMFINQFEWLTRSTLDESPAIPIKARFLVGA